MKRKIILFLSIILVTQSFVFGTAYSYFYQNLSNMDDDSKIMLLQCLNGFPKIQKTDFDENLGFLSYDEYSSTAKKALKENKLVRPKTYNEVNIETIKKAFSKGVLDEGLLSNYSIKKVLVGNRHHAFTSWYYKKKTLQFDYAEIVKWAARENQISEYFIANNSISQLEEEITVSFFGRIWDDMDEEEKTALLLNLSTDEQMGLTTGLVNTLAATGTASLVLSSLAASSGFGVYLGATALIHSAGALIGVTVPWAVYQGTTTILSPVLGALGPVGWSLLGLSFVAEGAYLGFTGKADVDSISSFIMSFHQIALANQ